MFKLPTGLDINNLIDDLRILSWEAADILLYYSKMLKDPIYKMNIIKTKNADDPVTIADLKVNDLIIKRIRENYENINWDLLSEENVKSGIHDFNRKSKWLWVLDPLDGTKDYIQGTGNYAMHLALNYEQKSYIGMVLIPEKNELWISDGKNTWSENRDGHKKKIKLNNSKIFQEMTLVTSKNHRNENLENLIDKANFKKISVMGSIGCKIASILRGESDIYISLSLPGKSSPKDWDFAAPEAILRAAGGSITNLENEDLTYENQSFNQGGVIIASNNKQNHQEVCLQIKEIIERYNIYPL